MIAAIAGGVVLTFVAALGVAGLVRLALDAQERRAQRAYVPPPIFTEVHPSWLPKIAHDWEAPMDRPFVAAVAAPAPTEETLAEFARRVPDMPAQIWCELEASRVLRSLAPA